MADNTVKEKFIKGTVELVIDQDDFKSQKLWLAKMINDDATGLLNLLDEIGDQLGIDCLTKG